MKVYIGWEPREAKAARICEYSINKRSPGVEVAFLRQSILRGRGYYHRKWHYEGHQPIDDLDGKPFSTEFSFTRFLTPILAADEKVDDWAIFVDCDFIFTDDVRNMELDPEKALMCVKHNFQPPRQLKMDDVLQEPYPRKNWSSLMAFNMKHPSTKLLTQEMVNSRRGSELHALAWLKDDAIGSLPERWNYLSSPRLKGKRIDLKGAIHYTWGMPDTAGYNDTEGAHIYYEEAGRYYSGV